MTNIVNVMSVVTLKSIFTVTTVVTHESCNADKRGDSDECAGL